MSLVYQNDFTEDSGNCVPACIATAFGMKLEEIPHFLKAYGDGWKNPCDAWMSKGLGYVMLFLPAEGSEDILSYMEDIPYFIVGEVGKSEYHMCLGQSGNLIHDPNPAGSGIRKIKDYVFLLQTSYGLDEPDTVFEEGKYLNEGMMGICIQEDCKCMTTSRVYEHTLTMQRRHFLCDSCLQKLGFKNGEVLKKTWQG